MKYRMLNREEMEIFNEDFKYFLIANGVSNEEWLDFNKNNKDKALGLVELFSDTVLQKVYEKVKFIEHRSASSCMLFKLNEDNIELISLNSNSNEVNLNTPEQIHEALINSADQLSVFKTFKNYSKNREEEIHEMLEQGCVNSSESFWILLEKLIS